jgi:Fe-S-cluster containining protein
VSDACASCEGRCCYDIVIRVTAFDAWRIARAQALPFEAIVDAERDEPSSGNAFRVADGYRALFLAKSDAVPRACTFLMHLPGDVRRCGVYADRPRVCAVYPMTIRSGSIDVRDDVTCAKSNWNMATLAYARWRGELATYALEWALHTRLVEVWNANAPHFADDSSAVAAFFAFAERACESIARDDRLDAAALRSLAAVWHSAEQSEDERARRERALSAVGEAARAALPISTRA